MSAIDPTIRTWDDYLRVYRESISDSDAFWDAVASSRIQWRKKWTQVSDCDFKTGKVSWFRGAELNVSENCLDRQIDLGRGDKRALIWVGNTPGEERVYTYRELHREVCRASNALVELGIKKGDRVVVYLPNIPELAITLLACSRVGAIHSVIFGGFSPHSIQSRVNDCGAKLIITANGTFRGEKWIDLHGSVDEAMAMGCASVEKVIVLERYLEVTEARQKRRPLKSYELNWKQWITESTSDIFEAPSHSAEDPLYILYTSGSTGKPKGVLHKMGGYLTYVTYTFEIVFQHREEDIFWCTADMGWITGHSYLLYGPLSNGATSIIFEGVPTYPDPGRFWEVVDRYSVSILYTAPTAIRILASAGDQFVKKYSRKSLRILGSVGEPINPEAWKWYHETVGEKKLPIVDTWWQTETGGALISPLAGVTPTKPGSACFPLPGVEPRLVDESGAKLEGEARGTLVLARSWPGQMTEVYRDPSRFRETYFTQFEGTYCTGDGCFRDADGYYWITGRTDDVIKVAGHRLGSAEVESACITHPDIIESGAVGVADSVTGEALHVFIVLKPGVSDSETLRNEVVAVVRKEVGPLATPKKIVCVPGLPKTRSGKIMRRILRKTAMSEFDSLGDLTTLADPGIVERIIAAVRG